MKFKLNMDEIGSLIRTHVETEYGRKTGKVMFNIEGRTRTLDVEVDDDGPMPPSTPAPSSIASGIELDEAVRMMSEDKRLQQNLAGMRAPNNPDHDKD